MKKLIIGIAFLLLIIPVFAEQSTYDFRQVKWSITKNEVTKLEKLQLIENQPDQLIYLTNIANQNCFLFYSFDSNTQLDSAGYIFCTEHTNRNDYIDDYDTLRTLLTAKYNEPNFHEVNWKNDLYKDSPQDYGTAISIGHVVCRTMWETPTTKILLSLSGDNFKINLSIIYSDKNMKLQTQSYQGL